MTNNKQTIANVFWRTTFDEYFLSFVKLDVFSLYNT